MKLSVNIDHVATLREARGEIEPDPVIAAGICELAGAEGIVCHLREDRRHINDRDVKLIREVVKTKFDLEMAATDEMIKIACDIIPDMVTLVPENRNELTTEGGLNITASKSKLENAIKTLHSKNILVSLFVDPVPENIDNSLEVGADIIELHTGKYSNTFVEKDQLIELSKIASVAQMGTEMGLIVTAGHGLNYYNIFPLLSMKEIREVSIGHSIISRAVYVGLQKAVEDMVRILQND
jgi:pyridoxine 5-phosphate synthase